MKLLSNIISEIVGNIISVKFPPPIQKIINKCFVKTFGIDLKDFNECESYQSIQALFTRNLKKERNFDTSPDALISPVDSSVAQFGTLQKNTILQVKGLSYDLYSFLTNSIDISNVQKIEDGSFINFYLSPKDYHHFHALCDFSIRKIVHVPGYLFPVKKSSLEKVENLFVKNERVILECSLKNGDIFYFIAIGALNVGKIKIFKEPKLQTNAGVTKNRENSVYNYPQSIDVVKGEDIGCFEMGSSIVLLFKKGKFEFDSILEINKKISFGDTFGNFIYKIFS